MDKKEARSTVQRRIDTLPLDISGQAIIEQTVALLTKKFARDSRVRVLTYQPEIRWREVDPTPLTRLFPRFEFTVAPVSKSQPRPTGQFDVALVPLYGFNDQGYRLGHGGGWYDRFLAGQEKIVKVGIGREIGRIDFHTERYDVVMDYVITERGTTRHGA